MPPGTPSSFQFEASGLRTTPAVIVTHGGIIHTRYAIAPANVNSISRT
jgi:hypothetical protein